MKHEIWKSIDKKIFAHRGYHDKPTTPENSIPAFKRAIDRGWGAELDVHILKDGSLVVFHDSELKRCTGVDGIIEELTLDDIKKLRLEGTENMIPLFDEVLDMFEGVEPLIIELKTYKGNAKDLVYAVCDRLDRYKGEFVIESFDPRALISLKKYRPNICRGQLSMDFSKEENDLPFYLRFVLTNLLFNVLIKPDFVAYKFEDRNNRANKRAIEKGCKEVSWTIRNKADFDKVIKNNAIPIFETFDPEI